MPSNTNAADYRPGRVLLGFGAVLALLVVLMAVAGTWTPRLGLDLRGGTTITLTAVTSDGSDVPAENLETARTIIQNRVDSLGVGEASVTIQGNDQIEVAVPNVNSDELVALVGTTARLNFRPVINVNQGVPASSQPSTSPSAQSSPSAEPTSAPSQTQEPSAKPTDPASTAQRGPAPQLPTAPPSSWTPRPTGSDVKEVDPATAIDYQASEQDLADFGSYVCKDDFPDAADQPLIACDQEQEIKYLLGPVVLSGEHVSDAQAGIPQGSLNWSVQLSLDDAGAQIFSDATNLLAAKQRPQNQFAIVLDGEVISAPRVEERISGGQASISGEGINEQTARSLASTLRYGALPIDLEVSSVDTVSATLGGNQLSAGMAAGLIGLGLVIVYSVIYYRGLTVVVIGSLLAAAAVTYTVMVLLGTVVGFALNLPGIAGAIVAIGVTADSFIVYFERIRDEIREGHSLRHSIESGWRKARNTILIADGVQLLAALVLYFLAMGSVKGFAFTLGVTTAIDLFLVVFFTHPLMSLLGRTKFFGEGHKWSGFSAEHIGVSRTSLLGRRGGTRRQKGQSPITVGQEG